MNETAFKHSVRILVLALFVPGCAGPEARNSGDPLQGFNRTMFKVNDALDKAILKPAAKGYQFITPDFVDTSVTNFFSNLGDITVLFNNLLQLKFNEAASDTGRFVTNTTIGVAGLFDVASKFGMVKHDEDFGQTLGYWGMAPGPYLVLPFFGPSNFRDGPSRIVDAFTSPLFYVEDDVITYSLFGLSILDTRADLLSAEEFVDDVAYDRYTFIRDAYVDRRRFLVYDGNPPEDDSFYDDIEDDDEVLPDGAQLDEGKPASPKTSKPTEDDSFYDDIEEGDEALPDGGKPASPKTSKPTEDDSFYDDIEEGDEALPDEGKPVPPKTDKPSAR